MLCLLIQNRACYAMLPPRHQPHMAYRCWLPPYRRLLSSDPMSAEHGQAHKHHDWTELRSRSLRLRRYLQLRPIENQPRVLTDALRYDTSRGLRGAAATPPPGLGPGPGWRSRHGGAATESAGLATPPRRRRQRAWSPAGAAWGGAPWPPRPPSWSAAPGCAPAAPPAAPCYWRPLLLLLLFRHPHHLALSPPPSEQTPISPYQHTHTSDRVDDWGSVESVARKLHEYGSVRLFLGGDSVSRWSLFIALEPLRGDGDGAEGLRGLGLASRFFGAKAMGAGRNDETWGGFLESCERNANAGRTVSRPFKAPINCATYTGFLFPVVFSFLFFQQKFLVLSLLHWFLVDASASYHIII